MQEEGKYLLAIVTALAVAALGILAVAARNETRDRPRAKHLPKADSSGRAATSRAKGRPAATGQMEGGAEEVIQSRMLIPPPDEPRIEAVAPKNDRGRIF